MEAAYVNEFFFLSFLLSFSCFSHKEGHFDQLGLGFHHIGFGSKGFYKWEREVEVCLNFFPHYFYYVVLLFHFFPRALLREGAWVRNVNSD